MAKKKVSKKAKTITPTSTILGASVITTKVKTKKRKTPKKSVGTCFILMPFKEPFGTYYNVIIEPAVQKAGLKAFRADSVFLPRPIMADIWDMIQGAKVVLAELTGKNPNVFYELGLGHAIGKPIVLISETIDDVPFDLQALRVITYDKDDPKWGDKLRNDIVSSLEATLSEPTKAVPTMFRKKVKSQAPAESEASIRLAALENRVNSLMHKEPRMGRFGTTSGLIFGFASEVETLYQRPHAFEDAVELARSGFERGIPLDAIYKLLKEQVASKIAEDIIKHVKRSLL